MNTDEFFIITTSKHGRYNNHSLPPWPSQPTKYKEFPKQAIKRLSGLIVT
jgi:hypothetical protein